MGNMEWLEDIAHERAQGLVCGNDQADKLIAAVRLAEKGYRELYGGLGMNLASRSELIQLVQEYRARLRSGDVEEKPCKPS